MINFNEICEKMSEQMAGNQKKIVLDTCVEVYFGYSFEGHLRLSFLSHSLPPIIKSTSILNVIQGRETKDAYWTSFDLLNADLKEAYFSFCENMIDSIIGIHDEYVALTTLKRRFMTWKILFQKTTEKELSKETIMGILGELIVLKELIAPKYGINAAIDAWGGPSLNSKDFSTSNSWYEVKTIGANTDIIHISSLAQLSSNIPGHLVVVRAEAVSQEYGGSCCSIVEVLKAILLMVSDETAEYMLISKVQSTGVDISGSESKLKFVVKSIDSYYISDGFPRITDNSISYQEITDVQYSISRAAIRRFLEE